MAEEEAEKWLRDAKEVLSAVEGHVPAIPPELVAYYAKKQGLSLKDPKVAKLIAVAAEEFLNQVLKDALEMTTRLQAQEKASSSGKKGEARKDLTLNLDVLAKALKESGINISGNQYL